MQSVFEKYFVEKIVPSKAIPGLFLRLLTVDREILSYELRKNYPAQEHRVFQFMHLCDESGHPLPDTELENYLKINSETERKIYDEIQNLKERPGTVRDF